MAWLDMHTFSTGDVLRAGYFEAMRQNYQELRRINLAINYSSKVAEELITFTTATWSTVLTPAGLEAVTITTEGNPVILMSNPACRPNQNTCTGSLQFTLDGAPVKTLGNTLVKYVATMPHTVLLFDVVVPAAGVHTIGLEAKSTVNAADAFGIYVSPKLFLAAWEL